jgi:TfoX/Sxy family transcriptional regulator of competence genes
MAWRKSPPELIALFESVIPHKLGVVAKPMFGYPACFVNGHMFMGLHQEDMVLRLSEADRAAALAVQGTRVFEPMPGKPMKEYVALAPTVLTNRDEVRTWVARALTYGSELPGKATQKGEKKGSKPAGQAAGAKKA